MSHGADISPNNRIRASCVMPASDSAYTGERDEQGDSTNKMQTYNFLRFRNGVRMAEGARVNAESLEEAKGKAENLFYDPGDEWCAWWPEVYVPATSENRTALTLRDAITASERDEQEVLINESAKMFR
jgi:hypothetical protein